MTTLPLPPQNPDLPAEFTDLTRRLDALQNRFRVAAVVRGLAMLVAVAVPVTVAAVFLAGYFPLPHWLSLCLLVIIGLVWLGAYACWLHGPLFRRPTYAETARLIETHAAAAGIPVGNELINAILLAEEWRQPMPEDRPRATTAWIPHVLREVVHTTDGLPLEQTIPWKKPRNGAATAVIVVMLCILAILIFPSTFAHGLAVFSRPTAFVPVQGSVQILSVEPGDDTLLAGQSVNFTATLNAPGNRVVPVSITMQFASGKSVTAAMTVFDSENTRYRYQLPTAAEDIDYIITAGATRAERSQSQRYHLTVLPQIHLLAYKFEAVPPAYTGKDKITLALAGKDATAARGSLEVPEGSQATLSIGLDIPAREVLLDVAGKSLLTMTATGDGKTFTAPIAVKDTLHYMIRVNDSSNRTLRSFPAPPEENASADSASLRYTLTATPDTPPTVSVTTPGKDLDAKPGEKVALVATAADDYGLTQVVFEIARNSEKDFKPVQTWPVKPDNAGKPVRSVNITHSLDLPASQFKLGDTLRYRFVVTDNRDLTALDPAFTPQSTPSQVFTIHFNDNAAAAAKTTKLWDELRKQLSALLDRQIALRKAAAGLTAQTPLEGVRTITTPIADGQKSLRADIAKVAKDFPFEPSMKLIQKSLQVLAVEDATFAVDRSADILLLSQTRPLPALAVKLRQHQDRIIDVLQTLLAIAQADEKHSAQILERPGEDLPNEAADAWKKISEELKKFEREQKTVINATADLAKKPKDSYDARDNQKLLDLAAVEDKWEKFLNDRLADMSKIAEQDQANASLLEELVQMKVELAAARDALQQKATEIATPLEENGLENAKALDTHIERMLMSKPDHVAWQMEDAVTQNDQAMAELPKQLQDMVGDLMDKEEDLTDEMESTGSKFADSLNKGAGWDAADGPISNMSAQGVTGNQMPKNMEIQGRSGEGREGRSSGEFVGAEAEGKGGRRTPTRMTQDPFSNGQVNDKSKEPAGGATGGGKKGGQGGEGLEGQAPPELQNALKRLAGTQAALRNQSERINLQMNATGFNNFKLLEAQAEMRKSEDALRQYHYQTALYYQQKAVQSLNSAKVLAEGRVHVQLDTTPTVSEKTRKEIESATNGPLPKGYADPVKAYFQKLANEPDSAR
jgi:hypothetical protein